MALTGTYVEMTNAYDLNETAFEITCVRVYHDAGSDATKTLPEVMDRLSSDIVSKYYDVRVWQVNTRKFGGHPGKQIYTVSYSNDPSKWSMSDDTQLEFLPSSGSVGGDIISLNNVDAKRFKWPDGSNVDQSIPRRVPSGSFKVTKRVSVLRTKEWTDFVGKVNSVDFTGGGNLYDPGQILFIGTQHEEYKDNVGVRKWKVDFTFEWKRCEPCPNDTYGGWLELFNEKTNLFETVKDDSGKFLYESANLNDLFKGLT